MMTNRCFTLGARPAGWTSESDFQLEERPIPPVENGEVLVQGLYLSVDP